MRLSAISARSAASGGSGQGVKASGFAARVAVDLGAAAVGAPDQIRLDADDRMAAAHRAAFHQLEQEAHRLAAAELEERRDRRLQVGDQRRPHHLRFAAGVTFGEDALRRLDLHSLRFYLAGRAAADDLVERGLVEADAEFAFQPRQVFAEHVVGVGILQRGFEPLRVRRVGVELGHRRCRSR